MYLRKTVKRYKGKTYVNHLLVESVATPRGPRQKVICSLGSLEPAPRAAWGRLAHKLEAAVAGQLPLGRPMRGCSRTRRHVTDAEVVPPGGVESP